MTSTNKKWLEERGWHTWYHPEYWVHPDSVEDPKAQDYTDYGMQMGDAVRYEELGKPKHKTFGIPRLSQIFMALDTKGLTCAASTKKTVNSSNLALRFYKADGWTMECLSQYVINGKIADTTSSHGDPESEAYFVPEVGCVLDIDRLYNNEVGAVIRAFNDRHRESDLEFMKRFNW